MVPDLTRPTVPPPIIQPLPPATTAGFVTLNGEGPAGTVVRVEGGTATVDAAVGGSGRFELTLPLHANRLDRLFVSALDGQGNISLGQPLEVLQDSQPPTLFIDFPTNNMSLTTTELMVAGRVGDGLSGYQGLRVWVHCSPGEGESPLATTQFPVGSPLAATVDVGIGSNGTYERQGEVVPIKNLTPTTIPRVGSGPSHSQREGGFLSVYGRSIKPWRNCSFSHSGSWRDLSQARCG